MRQVFIGRKTAIAAAFAVISMGAQAQMVTNGGFETSSFASGAFTTYDFRFF